MVAHDWGGMVAWALATSHPQRLKSLTVLSTPHLIALQESRKADPKQDRRLDYVRFFRLRDGSPESALLADGARRLRAAFLRSRWRGSRSDPLHLGGERHGARRGRRHENEGFRQSTLINLFAWLDMRTGFPMKASQICSP